MVKSYLDDGKIPEPLAQEDDGTIHTLLTQDDVGLAKETTVDEIRQSLQPLSFTEDDKLKVSLQDADLELDDIDVSIDELLGLKNADGEQINPAQDETVQWVQEALEDAATEDGSAFDVEISEPLEVITDDPVYETYQSGVEISGEGDTVATLNTKGNDTVTLALDAPGNNYEWRIDAATDDGESAGDWMEGFLTYNRGRSIRDTLELGASYIRIVAESVPSDHEEAEDTVSVLMSAS